MLTLTDQERAMAAGSEGAAKAMAMRIVAETGRLLGAEVLIAVASAHADGCVYHGDGGVLFVEKLADEGGFVSVPTTLNVGALDLLHPERVHAAPHATAMAKRMMESYVRLGCRPSWTCAPYQAGHRPRAGEDVAWGESNAVAFCNSVLGARTNRYGDFLDISAALVGRVPRCGLHVPENRRATLVVRTGGLNPVLKGLDAFYPVLGAWLGAEAGEAVAAIDGLPGPIDEDRLKALGAGAASTGAVGLFHIVGVTPEAPTLEAALQGHPPERVIDLTPEALRDARDRLSSVADGPLDAAAIGSPHLSRDEFDEVLRLLAGRRCRVPLYACTGRHTLQSLEDDDKVAALTDTGVAIVTDTCIVVTPILPAGSGTLITNSAKFAHYTPANTGWQAVFGSLPDVVESAVAGRVVRDEAAWS